ncbi:hypothetical protein [Lysobacter enzymogenes]|uniref:hypothetical protein n=1 Tax=Lysobacter enzymogenes TaxID=69 RepID=UPI001A95D9C6|nr:hypothetical protein [Lysobacter enzymogenes]QQP95223.1 hypothetical protein JHW38_18565 [Lysobacter enzymogenes]
MKKIGSDTSELLRAGSDAAAFRKVISVAFMWAYCIDKRREKEEIWPFHLSVR